MRKNQKRNKQTARLTYSLTRKMALAFLLMFGLWGGAIQAEEQINNIQQNTQNLLGDVEQIAGPEGVAGAFVGVHNNALILAGGSAFPEGKPWEGGQKYFSDAVLVFERDVDGQIQQVQHAQLPDAIAEGASVMLPEGLLCLGGQTPSGISKQVVLVSWINNQIQLKQLPELPVAVKNAAATVIGNTVYVVGGESAMGASNQFLKLDASNWSAGWQTLNAFPKPVTGASAVAQMDGEEVSVFVFGGRAKAAGANTTQFYAQVYCYRPSAGAWKQLRDIRLSDGHSIPLAVAAASPVGASHVILVGGDSGSTFNQVEAAINRMQNGDDQARATRDSLWINHTGFNSKILIYNTVTDVWFNAGAWEGTPVAVSTSVWWDGSLLVPGGEIKPAIRTPMLQEFRFSVKPVFGWLNYLVLGVYFIGMLLLGFYFMKRENSTDDFFKAGGRIPWWAAGISIFATTLSAITFIAIPAKSYATDWRMFMFNLAIIAIAPIIIRYFLPFFRRFNFDTAYQYLEARFNRSVRWLASALFVFFMVSRIAIVLFLPSLALNAVTGFNIYLAITVMGVVTIIYCTSGGMEAVVWGDVIQGFILVGGAFIALAFMLAGVQGGLGGFIDITAEHHKFHTFDFRFDFTQPVFWVVVIGGLANTLISYTSDQSVVQRYMTTKDEKATAKSIWLNGFLSIPVSIIFFLLGTGLYAYYTSNPEHMAVVNPNIDSVFPQFIVAQMPAGIAGLLIAAIFAAAMSTLSSNINSVSAVITSDFYKVLAKKITVHRNMAVARWSGIIVGVLGIMMALMLATWNIASLWDQFNTFLGLLTGGLGALFVMGVFFPRISGYAALGGVVGGFIVLLIVQNHSALSFLLYGFVSMVVTVIVALLLSLAMPNKKNTAGYTWQSRQGRA
ncbi:cyclically-permuted mutarotase family protein [Saccharicrinis carchari]|uniref:Cyclically-permuted mutarotase family protein n=1 Tax=Saccharicrinis carchari TaxID=1168039 RepID=A0A521ENX8_SACCC|nr:sodium/solute symporter [Saccharicrinis carchari]SMO85626.1 cyclically-permuted mutarotase family protein [Saccharicrinis carchari]